MATKLENPYSDEHREQDFDSSGFPPNGGKPPKKKSSKWNRVRPLLTFGISLAIVIAIVFGVFQYVKGHYFDPVDQNDTNTVEIVIPKGSSLNKISDILYDNDLIRNKQIFKLYADFSDMGDKLKAGTYTLTKDMTLDDIIYSLREGNIASEEIEIQFIEGQTSEDYAARLVDYYGLWKDGKQYTDLISTGGDFVEQYTFLEEIKMLEEEKSEDQRRKYLLEGYLFPDKYKYFTSASEEDIVKKQLEQFNKIFTPQYYERASELEMSVDEVVILASIIEKEAIQEDFKKVSAVFHNRLREDWKLDSDATVAYAAGVNKLVLDEFLDIDSPYNTRKYEGLPPGPICNPGKAAIEAVLYPEENFEDYFFFTLTDPDTGKSVFTTNIDDHNAEVAKYKELYQQADDAKAAQE